MSFPELGAESIKRFRWPRYRHKSSSENEEE
jgi:hypothetical protein